MDPQESSLARPHNVMAYPSSMKRVSQMPSLVALPSQVELDPQETWDEWLCFLENSFRNPLEGLFLCGDTCIYIYNIYC